jgi:hypothetical protein
MAAEPITYGQLYQLLDQLGFVCHKAEPDSRWYEHKDTDTVIILHDKEPSESARSTEVVSVRFHLDHKGLLGEQEIDQFFANGLVRQ